MSDIINRYLPGTYHVAICSPSPPLVPVGGSFIDWLLGLVPNGHPLSLVGFEKGHALISLRVRERGRRKKERKKKGLTIRFYLLGVTNKI